MKENRGETTFDVKNRIETNLSVCLCHLNSIRWATATLAAIDPRFHGDDDVSISSSWEGVLVSQQVALNILCREAEAPEDFMTSMATFYDGDMVVGRKYRTGHTRESLGGPK